MEYLGIEGSFRRKETIRRSVFITTLARAETPEQATEILQVVRKEFSDATHNCYAFCVGEYKKSSDDGEPQGTAGQPIAQVLKMRGCDKMLAVVTRYFGGIKLGAAGLAAAYAECVGRALDEADLRRYVFSRRLSIKVPYALATPAERALAEAGAEIAERNWEDGACFKAMLPEERAEEMVRRLTDLSCGKAEIISEGSGYAVRKIK